MISANGNLVITDWESSRNDVVAHDMVKLVGKTPEIKDLYSQWREKHVDVASADASRELAVIGILRGLDLQQKRRYFAEVTSESEGQAAARIDTIRRSVVNACNALFNDGDGV